MSTSPLPEQLERLVDRVEKELDRSPQDVTTANVGGLTKLGNELEQLLREATILALRSQGRDLAHELARKKQARGPGAYATLLRSCRLAEHPDPYLRRIAADLRKREASILWDIIEIRNANNHPSYLESPAERPETRRALRRMQDWLRGVLHYADRRRL